MTLSKLFHRLNLAVGGRLPADEWPQPRIVVRSAEGYVGSHEGVTFSDLAPLNDEELSELAEDPGTAEFAAVKPTTPA